MEINYTHDTPKKLLNPRNTTISFILNYSFSMKRIKTKKIDFLFCLN